MPPGSAVPVTRNFTLALLLKPLPVTVTSRLTVPCTVDDGSAAVTDTCWACASRAASALRRRTSKAIVEIGSFELPANRSSAAAFGISAFHRWLAVNTQGLGSIRRIRAPALENRCNSHRIQVEITDPCAVWTSRLGAGSAEAGVEVKLALVPAIPTLIRLLSPEPKQDCVRWRRNSKRR